MRVASDRQGKYLPIRCPCCSFQGKVAIARLDETFVCRKCKKPFHVNRDEVLPGPRPEAPVDDPWAELLPPERPSRWQRALARLPRVAWWSVAGATAIVVLVWLTRGRTTVELPEPLVERAVLLVQSKRMQEPDVVAALTPRAGRSAARDWYSDRPVNWGLPPAPDEPLDCQAEVRFRNEQERTAGVFVTLRRPPPEGDTEVLTYWRRNSAGLWEFDAERTLHEAR